MNPNKDITSLNVNELPNLLHEFWQRRSDACPLNAEEAEQEEACFMAFVMDKINKMTFADAFSFSMKYLAENHHPHTLAIIDSNSIQLLEGIKIINDDQYIVD